MEIKVGRRKTGWSLKYPAEAYGIYIQIPDVSRPSVSHVPHNFSNYRTASYTKYINHDDNPNIEWVPEEDSGAYRIFLRVKEGCFIRAGGELTADYGPKYWEGKQKYHGPRFLLH
jgi:hypothetical protein